jgi:hypothetical protein
MCIIDESNLELTAVAVHCCWLSIQMAAEGMEILLLLYCLFLSYWIMMRKSGMNNRHYVNHLKASVSGWE